MLSREMATGAGRVMVWAHRGSMGRKEEQQPPRAPVRSRQRQQDEEIVAAGNDRFKLRLVGGGG